MSRLKNKKKYYKKTIELIKKKISIKKIEELKTKDIDERLDKIEKITDDINYLVSGLSQKVKNDEELRILNDDILKKINVYKQVEFVFSLFKKNDDRLYIRFLLFTLLYLTFNFYFSFNHKQYIAYYVYTIIFSFSILYLCKINWKTVLTLVSIFTLIKYLFIHHDLSSYYASNIYFDVFMLFISLVIFYLVFLIEIFLIVIYLITIVFSILFSSIKFVYQNEVKNNIILYIGCVFGLLFPAVLLSYWSINLGFAYLIFIFTSILCGSLVALMVISDNQDARSYWALQLKDSYIVHCIFKILDGINIKISKIHENMTFMKDFSFLKLGKFSKPFFITLVVIWISKLIGIIVFFDTYNYNIIFYQKNNGYCSNLTDNDLILRKSQYDKTLLLSYSIKEDGFLLKEGDFTRRMNEENPKKYYIYEIKCEHNYKK